MPLREPWLASLQAITHRVAAEELERIVGSPSHQGVCAEVSAFHYADAAELLTRPEPLIVALDQVQDPQNLGRHRAQRGMRRGDRAW